MLYEICAGNYNKHMLIARIVSRFTGVLPGNKEAREGTARFLLRHRSERSHFNIFEHCVHCYARVVHRVLSAFCVVSMQRRI